MIRNAIQRFMYGRYGNDQLNTALLILYVALYVLYFLTRIELFYWISFVAILFALFRMLSPEPGPPPGGERQVFESRRTGHPVVPAAPHHPPGQGTLLLQVPQLRPAARVPRGKGKITVTCRSCGAVFEEKS